MQRENFIEESDNVELKPTLRDQLELEVYGNLVLPVDKSYKQSAVANLSKCQFGSVSFKP